MEDKKRPSEPEERSQLAPADKLRVARDEEPEVEGHRVMSGPEKASDPSIRAS